MVKIKYSILVILLFATSLAYSSVRNIEIINQDWIFVLDTASTADNVNWNSPSSKKIDLPHTWNNIDVTDDEPGYFRGVGWYQKKLVLKTKPGDIYFIRFEGANQIVSVFLNSILVGVHKGGYSSFSFNISSFLSHTGNNILQVRVDNRHNENIPPLAGDFNFFGGIYRDVSIISTSQVYFSGDEFDGKGVYWQTPEVSEKFAKIRLFGTISNQNEKPRKISVLHEISNLENGVILNIKNDLFLKGNESVKWKSDIAEVQNPKLWSVENPYQYKITSYIIDSETGDILDLTENPIGFRWYLFDPENGFSLNGKPLKLIGASRHQDFPGLGNALPKELHRKDVLALKDLGLNFLRIAHYPQDQEVLKACDELGILCSVEIPVVNKITESDEFSLICKTMMQEMIWQNYNHPSLIIWAYMNEVLLQPKFEEDTIRQNIYFGNVEKLAEELEKIARESDQNRYTLIPNHSAFELYNKVGLTKIPMLVGWNLYKGWYEANFEPLDDFLEMHHKVLPDKPLLITEYGAGNDQRLSSEFPERFDCSNEYAVLFHKYYLSAIQSISYVNAALIWNLNDFSSNQKTDATPYINNKGLYSFSREFKEPAYFYKANLSQIPFVKIFLPYSDFLSGIEDPEGKGKCSKSIIVYTNQDSVSMYLNKLFLSKMPVTMGMAEFTIPFNDGRNELLAVTGSNNETEIKDTSLLNFNLIPNSFKKFKKGRFEIPISCGDNRFIFDPDLKRIWLPDREYVKGSWGYIGGEKYMLETRRGVKPGSDQPILKSSLDPLYQTQRTEPVSYKFDTKPGTYRIELCFAQLAGSSSYDALRTGAKSIPKDDKTKVCFDIVINGETVLKNFYPGENGVNCAQNKSFIIKTNSGIEISFLPKFGKPFINALIIEKIKASQN